MSRAHQRGIFHKQPGMIELIGNLVLDASGDITTQDIPGVTAEHTSTGKYTLVLTDKMNRFLGAHVTVLKTTVANLQFQVNAADMSAPTVIVDCFTIDRSPNVLVEPASLTLHFTIKVSQSAATQ